MKLSAARVFVHDLPEAKRFYAGPLGLALAYDGTGQGFCVFDAGGCQLLVEAVHDEDPPDEQELVGRFTGLSFKVDDIAAAHERLAAAGVVFTGEPERQGWGGWLATFRDPAGNQLQLVQ